MSKKIIIISILLIAVLGGTYLFNVDNNMKDNIKKDKENIEIKNQKMVENGIFFVEKEKDAPDFTFKNLQGEEVSLSDYRGKNVIINFWATWCPYCIKEMPDLNKIYLENKDNDFVVLAIDIGESKDVVDKYLKDKDYKFSILLDEEGEVANSYMIRGIPTSYFIDKEGKIADIKMQMMTYDQMKEMVDKLK
ncbi:TlpA family protein disulfide reductase [Tepidibacter formicigenes]|jgi:peroxiredoxin|uniref:Peroxiredoxin n=1 Tax=Tepidibacter formicigenes DSM 15518 TaxID=1123349 RepID=A0A1M6MHS9_9FIRM|nr:TlpA disulfide reductase family protein [Tepidibacter formicigenes]SHJ83061.1 Peroxiredoxin [Tepidibacter formicigenes DSM 15518]